MAGVHREAVQKQIHQDWANREYIEVITASIKRITDFLNSFGTKFIIVWIRSQIDFQARLNLIYSYIPDMSCRSKLAVLNEKLTTLERRIEYLEACVTKGETLT